MVVSRRWIRGALSLPLVGVLPQPAFAQSDPLLLPVAQGLGRIPWLDAGIVVALAGAAIFAVCRSSRRV